MGYKQKRFYVEAPMPTYRFLMKTFGINMAEAQKMVDRGRVSIPSGVSVKKSMLLQGEVYIYLFEPDTQNVLPIFETDDFAVYDKPSGMMVHPRKRSDTYTLNDEIKSRYGRDANAAHRIDKSTSGLVLVGRNKHSEIALKRIFANRNIEKHYVALVHGHIEHALTIDAPLKRDLASSTIRLKVHVDESGKPSQTHIVPLKYFSDKNVTLVKAIPFTGRQHQIRVHLFHVKHSIVGDPIYGVSEEDAERFLCGELSLEEQVKKTLSPRLLLHAQRLIFTYKEKRYDIISTINVENEFYQMMQGKSDASSTVE